nr:rhomboid family intramembrane serine protease [uncultured Desulfuromonas sp.]
MFLPVGDLPNPPGRAYVNLSLMAANIMIFALITLPLSGMKADPYNPALIEYLHHLGVQSLSQAQQVVDKISAYDLFVFQHGFKPAVPRVDDLFFSLFLHAGLLHLGGNMLFLWIFGDNVEHRLGPWRYLTLYLFSGVLATVFFSLFTLSSYTPLIGASGAISGVLGCYFVWFPRNKVKTFIFLFPFIMTTILLPSRLVLGMFLVVDNLLPFLFARSGSGVAHGAHIGGFLAGGGVAYVIDRWPGMLHGKRLRKKVSPCENPQASAAERINCLIERDQLETACGVFFGLGQRDLRRTIPSYQVLEMGQYLMAEKHFDAALSLYRRFISDRPNDADLDQAYLGAGIALLNKENCHPSAHQYFLSVLDISRDHSLIEEARRYLTVIESHCQKRDWSQPVS